MTFQSPGYKLSSIFFLVTISILSGGSSAFGQNDNEDIAFTKVSIPGVIRSTQVSDIIQDKDGILWINANGLYRYDGFKFTFYKEVDDSKIKLTGKEISSIYYDSSENRILIATRNFGLMQYKYSTNSITKFIDPQGVPTINQFARTSDGRLWAAAFNNGVFYADSDTLKKINYLPNRFQSSLLADGKRLYVGQLSTVFTIEDDKIIDSIHLSQYLKDLPGYTRITSLFKDSKNQLWIGTERQGLFVYDLAKRQFTNYFDPTTPPFFSRVNRVLEDHEGLIWVLTKANGIAVYNPATNKFHHYRYNPASPSSINGDNCFSILEDNNGIIWIGAIGDLNKYDRQKTSFLHLRYNPTDPLSLSDNMVRGVFEDRAGKVWIGTDGGFINLYDRRKNSIEIIKVDLPGDDLNYVPMYFIEQDDRIMLVGSSHGLLQFDRITKKFSHFLPLKELTKNKMVRQLILDNDQLYFIFSGSLFIYNQKTKETKRYSNFGNRLAFNASSMTFDSQKRLWLGVRGGISLFDSEKDKFSFIPFEKETARPDSVLIMVLSIQEFNNKMYAGTFNHGLWEIDIKDLNNVPEPKNYTESDGFQNNTIYSSLPDDDGNLWISSNSGIVKFNPTTKKIIPFTVDEGLQDDEFNRLAYFKNGSGDMIFGGINGINIFRPRDIKIIESTTAPVITSVIVSNPFENDVVNLYLPQKESLIFDYQQNFITFNFSVPNYHEPKRFNLYYKLDEFDNQWKEVQSENAASYPNLEPGDYSFSVKSINLNGDEAISTLSFTIVPPLWKTWWFILIAFLVIAFFVMTIIQSYIRKATFDKQRLEALLKIRTFEIEQSREELRALNQKKDLIFSILSHDLRSPLTTLKGFLGFLIDNTEMLSKEDVRKHALSIRNSVTNSLDLIDNTLFWSLSQMGNIQYSPTTFQIRPVIEKVVGLYQLTAEKKMIKISLNCDESVSVYADENMMYVTLRNILSNAIKFTREGKSVTINCSKTNRFATIEVTDEGIGMSPEYLKKVLSMDQPMLKQGTSNEKGTGLGLLLCKNFVEMNKGKLHISSTENQGTTFIVTLPLAHVTAF